VAWHYSYTPLISMLLVACHRHTTNSLISISVLPPVSNTTDITRVACMNMLPMDSMFPNNQYMRDVVEVVGLQRYQIPLWSPPALSWHAWLREAPVIP
jgi:hypothetical protein